MAVTCPGCRTELRFEHSGSWALGCAKCDALVLRDGTRFPGATVDMPMVEDLSPLRVGSAGTWNEKQFRVTGRVRVESERGYRNYWSLRGDVPYAWLAQAFGTYALIGLSAEKVEKDEVRGAKPTRSLKLDPGEPYHVEMLDNRFRHAWEGEMMKPLPMPWSIEIEAGRPPNGKAILLVDKATNVHALIGEMVAYTDLRIENPPALGQWT
jgi:LSD1 subclass zinc finger protein